MANNIQIDSLADAIARAVSEYTEEVSEAIDGTVDEVAKECLKEIKTNSKFKSGRYSKGWKVVREKKRGSNRNIIWNPKFYSLVHLLEKGHAKRGGGRVAGKPHVGPAEQRYVAKLEEDIRSIIRNGG